MKKIVSLVFVLAVLLSLTGLPMSAAADDRPVRDSGSTAHGVNWTLYMDGTLVLSPVNDRYTYWIDKGDDQWHNREYPVDGQMSEVDSQSSETLSKKGYQLVTSLVIEDHIGIYADSLFLGYPNLREVILPELRDIPAQTFYYCYKLETVTVNGSVDYIRSEAFNTCKSLRSVTVHGDVGGYNYGSAYGGIEYRAFYSCESLQSFQVDGIVGNVGESAFAGANLARFDALVCGNIGDSAFSGNEQIMSFSPIRGNVQRNAFKDTKLAGKDLFVISGHNGAFESESLPFTTFTKLIEGPSNPFTRDGTNYIEITGFTYPNLCYTGTAEEFAQRYKNESHAKVTYQKLGDSVIWVLQDGVLNIAGTGPTIDLLDHSEQPWANIPGKGTWDNQRDAITKVRVDRSVQLGAHMLDYLENKVEYVYSVEGTLGDLHWGINRNTLYISGTGDIPNMYERDDEAWLPYRNAIVGIVIEDGVTAVGFGAFKDCSYVERVSLADSVKRIDGGAFYGCMDLSQIDLPEGLTTIGRNAFTDCESLQTIYIPRSVTSIGSQAFLGTGLTDIYYGGRMEEWEALKVTGLYNVTVHPSYHSLPGDAAVYPGGAYPEESEPESEPVSENELTSPDTGDRSFPALWLALMLLALGAAAVLAKKQKAFDK